jgi:hypothetical protein
MKRFMVIIVIGLIFGIRYLFLMTVMAEERTIGGFYEPLKVVDINMDASGNPFLLYESFIRKKIGPFELLTNSNEEDSYPKIKLKLGNKEYILLFADYVGPILQIYIPEIYMKIFGRSIYSIRSILFFIFLFFLFFYMKLLEKFWKMESIYISLFLITFPLFGMEFLTTCWMSHPFIFTLEIIIIIKLKKVIEEGVLHSPDAFSLLVISALILHIHLLTGGAFLLSVILSFLIVKKDITMKIKPLSIIGGYILFLILISPFFLISPVQLFKDVVLRGGSLHRIFFLPKSAIIHYLSGIFAFPSFLEVFLGKGFGTKYLLFSIPSGLILSFGFLGIIPKKKDEKSKKLIFFISLFYLIITLFADVRSYHINYILPFISLFIPYGLKKFRFLSDKVIKYILIFGIFLNIIQIEMLRESIKNSSLSLSLHKEVAEYLIKNRINRINNFAGRTDFVFISKEKIEVRDFAPFFFGRWVSNQAIFLSLIASKGEVILLERFRRSGYTTGISLEMVLEIAQETGLKIRVLKKFPDDNYQLALVRIE